MSLRESIANFVARVLNLHPATQYSPGRSWVRYNYGDAKIDIGASDRKELQRLARAFEAGNAIVNRMADIWESYVVGPNGLQIFPASSSELWNERALSRWNQWKPFADIASRDGWDVLQGRIARSWFIDGEVFILLVTEGQFTRVQLVEAHRCRTPDGKENDKNIVDGVQIDSSGRPIAYWIQTGENTMTKYDASYVVHIFEPSRVGQYRGIPLISCVLNDLRDLDDLQILEMKAAKNAARIAIVQKTKSGEVSTSNLYRSRSSASNQSPTGAAATQARQTYYQDAIGGETVVLQGNDEIAQFLNNRPSVVTREYWRYVTEKVCAGVGIPYVLVFPDSMQGTVYRGALDMANAFFRARSAALANGLQRVYEWVIGNDTALISGRPGDWRMTSVRPPRAVNVDVGRNSSAAINELAAGLRTYQSLYGEVGADWKRELRQKAVEAAFKHGLVKEFAEFGVTAEEIASSALPAPDSQPKDEPDV